MKRARSFYGGGCREGRGGFPLPTEEVEFGESEDIIYYNINMVNNVPTSKVAESVQNLTAPIISNAKDYVMATIRFVLDGNSIPIFTFKDGAYFVTMTNLAIPATFSQVVLFSSLASATRSIFSYKAFIAMINTAWAAAWVGVGSPGAPLTGPPFMVYVEETGTIDFVAPLSFSSANIQCFMNSNLYGFFNNYWDIRLGENLPSHQDVQIIIRNINNTNVSSPYYTVPANYLVMSQDYQSLFNWFDTTGIVFISNTLGVKPEYMPVGNPTADLTTDSSAGTGTSSVGMLTDFQPYIADPSGVRGYLYYASEGPWRIATLENDEIRSIQIKIMLRDRVGNMSPYMIPPNQSVQIKLVFMPKSYYMAGKK